MQHLMAARIDNLPAAFSCERAQNSNISRLYGSTVKNNGAQLHSHKFIIYCRMKNRHRSSFKAYPRQPFRRSTSEDALITSWALYNYNAKDEPNSSKASPDNKSLPSHQSMESPPGSLEHEYSKPAEDGQEKTTFVAAFQDRNGRRTSRAGNPSMSLSQSLDGPLDGGYTMVAMGPPAALSKQFPGSAGLYMALVFALVGITTAGASLLGLNSSQEECTRCSGYGVERCHLCKCTGTIEYQGEFWHVIPCPLCLGSCMKKCSSCDGVRMKKGVPPFIQKEQFQSSKRSKKWTHVLWEVAGNSNFLYKACYHTIEDWNIWRRHSKSCRLMSFQSSRIVCYVLLILECQTQKGRRRFYPLKLYCIFYIS